MKKDGEILVDESLKVILAVAVVASMIWLVINLISPVFDKGDEVSESYFEMLSNAIEDSVSGDASFFILDNGDEDLNFYLVYFGSVFKLEKEDKVFVRSPNKKGTSIICICVEEKGNVICNYCDDVESSVVLDGGDSGEWVVGEGVRMNIKSGGGGYEFSVVE